MNFTMSAESPELPVEAVLRLPVDASTHSLLEGRLGVRLSKVAPGSEVEVAGEWRERVETVLSQYFKESSTPVTVTVGESEGYPILLVSGPLSVEVKEGGERVFTLEVCTLLGL